MVMPRRQAVAPRRQGLARVLVVALIACCLLALYSWTMEGDSDRNLGLLADNKDEHQLERFVCTKDIAKKQEDRIALRFTEWWSHSACPDQVWMEDFPRWMKNISPNEEEPVIVLDIGCNKGYTSADFIDLFNPTIGMNPKTIQNAIEAVGHEDNTKYDRTCGACSDCKKPVNANVNKLRSVEVHCFEPSPATYHMLTRVKNKLHVDDEHWHIYNTGLHEQSGMLTWHKACKNAVGDELCTIVPNDTPDSIQVEVVTVDEFGQDKNLIHMLKIDAEGEDPAVLRGAQATLESHRAVMVMFEYNPGLRNKDPPHGLWGKGGTDTLLGMTEWLDSLSYDCYLDSRVKGPDDVKAPPLYRITGGCLSKDPKIRGWANVVCASRAFPEVAKALLDLAPLTA